MSSPNEPPSTDDEAIDQELAESEHRRRRIVFALSAAFMVVLLGVVIVQWSTDSESDRDLPAFALTTLDGESFELRSVLGTPTVLNFFASWCPPCLDELPDFEAASRANADRVNFVGINTRETSVDDARDLLEEAGVTFRVLLGDDGALIEEIGGVVMPTTAFIDADGSIVQVHSGPLNLDALTAKIDQHFG